MNFDSKVNGLVRFGQDRIIRTLYCQEIFAAQVRPNWGLGVFRLNWICRSTILSFPTVLGAAWQEGDCGNAAFSLRRFW